MKRSSIVLGCGIVAMLAANSFGQSRTWFDIRDNASANQGITSAAPVFPYTNGQGEAYGATPINAGARGAAEVLRLCPVMSNNYHSTAGPAGAGTGYPNLDLDNNASTGDLWQYWDMDDDLSGTGDVLSSIGEDITIAQHLLPQRGTLGSVSMTVANDATVAANAGTGGSPAVPWNGTVNGTGSVTGVVGTKMVRVPVTSGPTYAAALGIQPGGPYRIAKMRVTAGTRNCTFGAGHDQNSSYDVKKVVNNLLITRVFQSGGDAQEDVQAGYDPYGASGTFGLLDIAVNGSTSGATSATADAVIQIRVKGDNSGDGRVLANDLPGFNTARATTAATITQSQAYLDDFTNDRRVLSNDLPGFNAARVSASTTPCP